MIENDKKGKMYEPTTQRDELGHVGLSGCWLVGQLGKSKSYEKR